MSSKLRNPDKLWHFLASIGLVLLFYGSTVLWLHYHSKQGTYQRQGTLWKRLSVSCAISFVIMMIKEMSDYIKDDWFWCPDDDKSKNMCKADVWDIVVFVDGIIVGALLVVIHLMWSLPPQSQSQQGGPPCDETVASTNSDEDEALDDDLDVELNLRTSESFKEDPPPRQGTDSSEEEGTLDVLQSPSATSSDSTSDSDAYSTASVNDGTADERNNETEQDKKFTFERSV